MERVARKKRTEAITRTELAQSVYLKSKLQRGKANPMVTQVLDEISDALVRDGIVNLSGFGFFTVRSKPERALWNPKNKKKYIIPARRTVSFRPAPEMQQKMNAKNEPAEQ